MVKAATKRKGLAAAEGSCVAGGGAGGGGAGGADEDPFEALPEFTECLTKAIAEDLAKKEGEANKSMRMLELVGDRARNYTCADPEMQTSNSSLTKINWNDPEGGLTYNAEVGRRRRGGRGGG